MATRRPIVLVSGVLRELPIGDAVPGTTQWHTDAGAPSNGLGVDGDYYLNSDNGAVYNKAGGVWVLEGNIQGPAGISGAGTGELIDGGSRTDGAALFDSGARV